MNKNSIIGQSLLIEKLDTILDSGRIAHAYLFTGSPGIGKRTIGDLFAKALICEGQGEKPCNNCRTCQQFDSGNHPDVLRIERLEDKTQIVVDQIKDLQSKIKVRPYQGGKRICIIDDAETMKEPPQNKLLKTLEEPPKDTIIFLLSDSTNALLPTIISRCQIINIPALSRKEVAMIITNRTDLNEDEAMTYAALSQGNPGQGLLLADSEDFKELRNNLLEGMEHIGSPDILELSNVFTNNRKRYDELLDILIMWFRDLLVLKETNAKNLIINVDKISMLKQQLSLFTRQSLKDIIELIEESRKIIKSNGNFQLTIENMLLQI